MNEFLKEALEKIDKGMKEKLDRYGDAMKAEVCPAPTNGGEGDG